MVLSFTTRSNAPVPDGTIRKTWDKYKDSNFRTNLSRIYHRANLNGQCLKSTQANTFSSGKVPIGAWVRVHDGGCENKNVSDNFIYGVGVHSGSSFPQRLTDDVASNCAGGSALSYEDYPSTVNKRAYNNNGATTDKCFIGTSSSRRNDVDNYTQGGVHYPVFCQLGDYVETNQECKNQCNNVVAKDPNSVISEPDNYCNFAKDRLCGKQKGDPLKKNEFDTSIPSEKNWITEKVCRDYCGGPGENKSAVCQRNKREFCNNPNNWPDASNYCFEFWKKNQNNVDMEGVCGDELVDPSSVQNITKNLGCGFLCRGSGLDVNDNFCTKKRFDFCTKKSSETGDYNNMETEYCFQFCKDHPDLCENSLNDYCKDKKELLDTQIPGPRSGRKYSDYCGCMMDTQFYEDYVNNIFSQFKEGGFEVQGAANIKTEPECIFPKCKSGSILTSAQKENISQCGANCLQIMLNNITDTEISGDFMTNQSAKCTNIKKTVTTPPATTEPVPANEDDFQPGADGQVIDDAETKETDKTQKDNEIAMIIGIVFLIIFVAVSIGFGIWINKK